MVDGFHLLLLLPPSLSERLLCFFFWLWDGHGYRKETPCRVDQEGLAVAMNTGHPAIDDDIWSSVEGGDLPTRWPWGGCDGKCERYFAIYLVIEGILDKEFEIIFHVQMEINYKIIRPLFMLRRGMRSTRSRWVGIRDSADHMEKS